MKDSILNPAVDYPLLNMFWIMLMILLWVLWFFLLFRIITLCRRSEAVRGVG
ncbi:MULTISPECIES: hypothetical protein [Streptomyces]|uniref:Uncharacterized protein n=1 Tax=Streptomyces galilaeus TaxID=33899 RepID=A0ABW9IW54_STRGJ